MGVGAEGKARVIVSQRAGQCLDIHAVLEGQRGEGVSEVVKSDVLRADGLQNFIVGSAESVRVIHSPGLGRWKQIRIARVLFVFGNQQVDRLLRKGRLQYRWCHRHKSY